MTVPDPTAPPAEDVIAAVLRAQGSVHSARREYPDRYRCEHPERYGPCTCAQEIADAVVAAIRAMTVAQLADLVDAYCVEDEDGPEPHLVLRDPS